MPSSKKNGFSLIETIFSIALMGISALAFATMMNFQIKEQLAIEEKMSLLELESNLIKLFSDDEICSCQLNPLISKNSKNLSKGMRFDSKSSSSKNPIHISLAQIQRGCDPSSDSVVESGQPLIKNSPRSRIKVDGIRISNLVPAGSNDRWTGDIEVSFQSSSTMRNRRPISLTQYFTIDSTNPNASYISSCGKSKTASADRECAKKNVSCTGNAGITFEPFGYNLPNAKHLQTVVNHGLFIGQAGRTASTYATSFGSSICKWSKPEFDKIGGHYTGNIDNILCSITAQCYDGDWKYASCSCIITGGGLSLVQSGAQHGSTYAPTYSPCP